MTSYFISDLHLDASRPDILEQFIRFNQQIRKTAKHYYILGDFLEYWIGDDDPATGLQIALDSLKAVADAGVQTYLMHGNRDFLIGQNFAHKYGISLIQDPTVIDLYGRPTLLMHGDLLCTADLAYQAFRKQVRDEQWQTEFLNKTIAERLQIVDSYRAMSKHETSGKSNDIMDVDQAEVESRMKHHQVTQMIHGHTHRPNTHHFFIAEKAATRIVLGDWYKTMTYLAVDEHGMKHI